MHNAGDRERGRLLTRSPRPPLLKWRSEQQTVHGLHKRSLRVRLLTGQSLRHADGVGSSNTSNERWMDGWMDANKHGARAPMQSRDAAAYRAVPAARAMV